MMGMRRGAVLALAAVVAIGGSSACRRRVSGAVLSDDGGMAASNGVGAGPQKMTPAEADAAMADAATDFSKPTRDCKTIVQKILNAASFVEAPTPNTGRAFYAGARCAESTHNYRVMLAFGSALAKIDPPSEKFAFVPRALLMLNRPKDAIEALRQVNGRHPNEPEILLTGAEVALHEHEWPDLLKLADATAKAVHVSSDAEQKVFGWRAEWMRTVGYVMTGDLTKAEQNIDVVGKMGAPQAVTDELHKEIVPMRLNKIGVDVDTPKEVFLGSYHLLGRVEGIPDLAHITIVNFTGKDQVVKVEMEIPGITEKATKSLTLMTGKTEDVALTPPLRADWKPSDMTVERASQINVKVTLEGDAEKVVYDDAAATKLYPRDQWPAATLGPLVTAAWVTPQAPPIEEFMTAAKKRAPGGTLAGSLAPTVPQVRAIYDELKARGLSYVLVTDFGSGNAQHVRLPVQSLTSTNALCIDGAVLFATLLEKIGLKPFIVLIPGHAFVGWHAEAADKQPAGTDFFLETTVVSSRTFESAMDIGLAEAKREKEKHHFDTHQSYIIDILAMRQLGVTAQPWN